MKHVERLFSGLLALTFVVFVFGCIVAAVLTVAWCIVHKTYYPMAPIALLLAYFVGRDLE